MLEPRVLLDAAAVRTAQEAIAQQQAAPPPEPPQAHPDHAGLMDALAAVHQDGAVPAAGAEPARTEVYFIDASVADAAQLAQALPSGSEVHFIDAQADGVAFIAQTLAGRSDISAIHILSHGEAGALQLGTAGLTTAAMQGTYRDALAAIGQSLTADGDILIYGCDFGTGTAGSEAVQTLASLTGADVAASTDDTGAAALGGDWALERQAGTVETRALAPQDWDHLMAAPVLSTTPVLTYAGAEDAPAPTGAVGALVSDYTVGMSDADPGAVKGIAITGNVATRGTWWYTTDGGATWTQVGAVTANNALLLADNASTRLYFQANPDFNGNAGNALTLRGWDQSAGTAGTKASPGTLTGSLSSASDTVAVSVTAVNDAPTLTTTAFSVGVLIEDLAQSTPVVDPNTPPVRPGISSTSFSLAGSDADVAGTLLAGFAIVEADNTNGQWWFSTNSGNSWTRITNASEANALLLQRSNASRLFFQPNADWNGEPTITIRAWDMSTGTSGQFFNITSTGGTSAFSSTTAIGTATLRAVADITADTLTAANAAQEDTPKSFNPITGTGGATADTYEATTKEDVPFNGRVVGTDGDGDVLTYTVATQPINGTVTMDPATGTYVYTPRGDFNGIDTFTVNIDDGTGNVVGVRVDMIVTSVIDISDDTVETPEDTPVPEPPAPPAAPDVPVAQDFPFVFVPAPPPPPEPYPEPPPYLEPYVDPFRNAYNRPRPYADANGLFVEPAVVIAVNGQNWLGGTPTIVGASGVVLQAVNGVDSLGGLNTLGVRGAVVAAVDDLSPLGSIDTRDAGHKGDWMRSRTGTPLDVEPGRIASLDLGNDVRLTMTQEGERVWIDVQGNVREVRASLADGGALPPWVHVDRRGFVAIDRPANADRLRLRLTVVPERGATRSHTVDLDFNAGELREVNGNRREHGRAGGRASQGTRAELATVPDFGTQLERAATRPVAYDAELLEALALV